MARKWEIKEGVFAWNTEQCEELVLIAGYEEIKPFIPPGSIWVQEFENYFYQHGNGIACAYIDEINAVRRRRGLQTLIFRETDVLDYGRSTNKFMKSESRQRTRDQILSASLDVREQMVRNAQAKIAELLPPHIPYEEYKVRKQQYRTDSIRSHEEVTRRVRAHQDASAPPVPKPPSTLEFEKAITMLKYASKPELRAQIIGKMSYDDAIAALEKVEDPDVRDALITHSLTAL